MTECVIIPLKRLSRAKTRLSHVIPPRKRKKLMLKLFNHVLKTCTAAGTRCVVVAEELKIKEHTASQSHVFLLDDSGNLNKAVEKGLEYARRHSCKKCLIVFADLPFLTVSDVTSVLKLLNFCDYVICPDLKLEGTNIVALHGSDKSFKPVFGRLSYIKFSENLENFKTYVSLGTSLDLDTSEQLQLAEIIGFRI